MVSAPECTGGFVLLTVVAGGFAVTAGFGLGTAGAAARVGEGAGRGAGGTSTDKAADAAALCAAAGSTTGADAVDGVSAIADGASGDGSTAEFTAADSLVAGAAFELPRVSQYPPAPSSTTAPAASPAMISTLGPFFFDAAPVFPHAPLVSAA